MAAYVYSGRSRLPEPSRKHSGKQVSSHTQDGRGERSSGIYETPIPSSQSHHEHLKLPQLPLPSKTEMLKYSSLPRPSSRGKQRTKHSQDMEEASVTKKLPDEASNKRGQKENSLRSGALDSQVERITDKHEETHSSMTTTKEESFKDVASHSHGICESQGSATGFSSSKRHASLEDVYPESGSHDGMQNSKHAEATVHDRLSKSSIDSHEVLNERESQHYASSSRIKKSSSKEELHSHRSSHSLRETLDGKESTTMSSEGNKLLHQDTAENSIVLFNNNRALKSTVRGSVANSDSNSDSDNDYETDQSSNEHHEKDHSHEYGGNDDEGWNFRKLRESLAGDNHPPHDDLDVCLPERVYYRLDDCGSCANHPQELAPRRIGNRTETCGECKGRSYYDTIYACPTGFVCHEMLYWTEVNLDCISHLHKEAPLVCTVIRNFSNMHTKPSDEVASLICNNDDCRLPHGGIYAR